MNVFYADDDSEDREIFYEAIQDINPTINVTLSKDGQEALEILSTQEKPPNFIFLDINMPRMNGIECLAKLKSDDRLKSIPVIIYSSTLNSKEVEKMITLGAKDYIPKAPSYATLKESINKVLATENSTIGQ